MPNITAPNLGSERPTIPGEIIALIAEKCIEPYNIRCDRWTDLVQDPTDRPNPVRLAVTSRAFSAGIKQGLRDKFKGDIRMNDVLRGRDLPIYLRKHNLDFLIPEVTKIKVNGRVDDPFGGVIFNEYPDLRAIEVCYAGDICDYPRSFWPQQPELFDLRAPQAASDVRDVLVDRGRDMLWMDKLTAGVTILVDYSYEWIREQHYENKRLVLDVSQDEVVVITREHFNSDKEE